MSLLNLGIGGFLLGLAAIAGGLFFLQRLRVRYREVEVITTLFWKQAVEETRARVLVRRFRHPLAYLLFLCIGALLWLAVAEPRWNREDEADVVFLLDGSAGMDWGDRYPSATELLKQEAARIPAERRRVYFCGSEARLVLDRGEPAILLDPRLASLAPEACPASVERELAMMLGMIESETRFLVVGDAPIAPHLLDTLPDRATVERLRNADTPRLDNNVGVAAMGITEAASGAHDRVDVMFRIEGTTDPQWSLRLDAEPIDAPVEFVDGAYYLRDLPSQGQELEIELASADPLPADNTAAIRLPRRSSIAVRLEGNNDERFRAVIEADPALATATAGETARVVVGGAPDNELPAMSLVEGNGITVVHEPEISQADYERMMARFVGIGLERVGRLVGMETPQPFELSLDFVSGERRAVKIGADLLGDNYDFTQTAAFPLMVAEGIRWLAGTESIQPFATAGERLVDAGKLTRAGAPAAPPTAGRHQYDDGTELAVSLAAITPLKGDDVRAIERATTAYAWPEILSWCVFIALILVGVEWWCYQKGRLP